QKEVGDRLAAQPGTKAYGSLTVFIKYYFEVKKMFLVSKNAFFPKPNVDSLIVKFEKTPIKYEVNNEKLFFKFVKDAFVQKRKTLKNNIKNYDLIKVEETLKKYNLDLTVRAEKLSIEQFIDITNNL
ncbi:MAG: rRNA adenine dimethyltransferase family protein, partial [Bacilli bacterium]